MLQGSLFTRDFLLEGVAQEEVWKAMSEERVAALRQQFDGLLRSISSQRAANEAETEHRLIFPMLKELGWSEVLPQQNLTAKGRQDVPDALLFGDQESLVLAQAEEGWQRFRHGLCLLESKRWNRPLDRPAEGNQRRAGEEGVPSTQILRYLRRADDLTQGSLRWGILTNGRLWRLYWQGAVSVSEDFLEIDLGKVFSLPGCTPDLLDPRDLTADHTFRLFLLLFGRQAFLAEHGSTFHAIALEQGRRWEERVAQDLSRIVFDRVFPVLATEIAKHDRARPYEHTPAWLEEVRQSALFLLYRLLFVLYAEDRDLLPSKSGSYAEYALSRIRRDVAKARSEGRKPSRRAGIYWTQLKNIFRIIAEGDDDLGVPQYNGGLFDPEKAPVLERVDLSDATIAEVIFALSYVDGERGPQYVNYRDLSVQQLGSIYERILEFGLRTGSDGQVTVDRDASERHDSGSFYTPEALVLLIIERAIGPLLQAGTDAFGKKVEELQHDRRPLADRLTDLAALDPATALLELKVCDPAMGSGHFLVSLVDWLADRVLQATVDARARVSWGEYSSPLSGRIAAVRARILDQARNHRWPIVEEQLDDRHVVRRMILKRVVHGVDKNPMAVELAKVALWLHTFTVGAPLSFLDHHLRCGDSIVGAWIRPTLDAVAAAGGLLSTGEVARVEQIADLMTEIEETTDNDVVEVKASAATFGMVAEATHDLDAFFSLMTARPALGVNLDPKLRPPRRHPDQLIAAGATAGSIAAAKKQQDAYERAAAFKSVLERQYGDPLKIATGEVVIQAPVSDETQPLLGIVGEGVIRREQAIQLIADARALAARERFLHWPIAFPNVWRQLSALAPDGGFDAVIGNPPYVRQELLASVKPALQASYATYAGTADLYVYFFEQGLRLVKPGGRVAYVVANKWLKAGYAEEMRAMLADSERAETEVLVDFGHARAFFPGVDVFPNVAVIRRPNGQPPSETLTVAVPSRQTLPDATLGAVVEAASFPLARAVLSRTSWTLEPKPVMDLLAKIRRAGVPLNEYAGVKPYRGVLTGFNEAFLIDTVTRDRLVEKDPASAEIIKPYLRGQDIKRWRAPDSGLHMVLLKSSSDYHWPWSNKTTEIEAETVFESTYPSIYKHMKCFESMPGDKTGEMKGLRHRLDHGRYWWELRPCTYYEHFEKPKIFWQAIQFHPAYSIVNRPQYGNNKTYILPTTDLWLLAVFNSPLFWWISWRHFLHMKDEALSNDGVKFLNVPIPRPLPDKNVSDLVSDLLIKAEQIETASDSIHDWLRLEFGLDQPTRMLEFPERLDADNFASVVRASLPSRRKLSAADVGRLKREHADTLEPARRSAVEVRRLEQLLSDLVNASYGLTESDIRLMWDTAPPRMPLRKPIYTSDTNG